MSRVHAALKVAESLQPNRETPSTLERAAFGLTDCDLAEDFTAPPELEEFARVYPPPPRAPRSLFMRLKRRVTVWLGIRAGGPVPTCNAFTRRGLPCRGPAMANGYCRMHGGSRKLFS